MWCYAFTQEDEKEANHEDGIILTTLSNGRMRLSAKRRERQKNREQMRTMVVLLRGRRTVFYDSEDTANVNVNCNF